VFSHAAGPAELPVWQIRVPDLNLKSRAPGPAFQFQFAHVSEPVGARPYFKYLSLYETYTVFLCTKIFLVQRLKRN
jgi:hypothetical protein